MSRRPEQKLRLLFMVYDADKDQRLQPGGTRHLSLGFSRPNMIWYKAPRYRAIVGRCIGTKIYAIWVLAPSRYWLRSPGDQQSASFPEGPSAPYLPSKVLLLEPGTLTRARLDVLGSIESY